MCERLARCLLLSSLSGTDVVLSPSECFKAARVNSSDSTYKSTCRLLKANNLGCKAKNLNPPVAYLTRCSAGAHTNRSQLLGA